MALLLIEPQHSDTASGWERSAPWLALVAFLLDVWLGAYPAVVWPPLEIPKTLLYALVGSSYSFVFLLSMLLWLVACVGWLRLYWRRRKAGLSGPIRQGSIIGVLALSVLLLLANDVPLRVSFWLHRAAFEELIDEARRQGINHTPPGDGLKVQRLVGIYPISFAYHDRVLIWGDEWGFVKNAHGRPLRSDWYTQVADDWQAFYWWD